MHYCWRVAEFLEGMQFILAMNEPRLQTAEDYPVLGITELRS